MAIYQKQNFKDGEILYAQDLTHIEDGLSIKTTMYTGDMPLNPKEGDTWYQNGILKIYTNGDWELMPTVPKPESSDSGKVLTSSDGTLVWTEKSNLPLKTGQKGNSFRQENTQIEDESYSLGDNASAFGNNTKAPGINAISQGENSNAVGMNSHSSGQGTKALGMNSYAGGKGTIASASNQVVIGSYNKEEEDKTFIIGNGTEDFHSNAHTVDSNGTAWFANDVKIGGQNQQDENAMSLKSLLLNRTITEVGSLPKPNTVTYKEKNIYLYNNKLYYLLSKNIIEPKLDLVRSSPYTFSDIGQVIYNNLIYLFGAKDSYTITTFNPLNNEFKDLPIKSTWAINGKVGRIGDECYIFPMWSHYGSTSRQIIVPKFNLKTNTFSDSGFTSGVVSHVGVYQKNIYSFGHPNCWSEIYLFDTTHPNNKEGKMYLGQMKSTSRTGGASCQIGNIIYFFGSNFENRKLYYYNLENQTDAMIPNIEAPVDFEYSSAANIGNDIILMGGKNKQIYSFNILSKQFTLLDQVEISATDWNYPVLSSYENSIYFMGGTQYQHAPNRNIYKLSMEPSYEYRQILDDSSPYIEIPQQGEIGQILTIASLDANGKPNSFSCQNIENLLVPAETTKF